jgi:pantoate--beta-alanine ligase
MILLKEATKLTAYLQQLRQEGARIGFAPTMGALHDGHISLIEKSKSIGDITVCSIFVNPTQFNDPKDFEKYPVTLSNDVRLLERSGCDVLFLPSVNEIYPNGITLPDRYELGDIEYLLEGKYRPGHFQGVCQVVHRLLEIVKPHHIFMGQKDYQQCLVVKKLVQLINQSVEVITVPTCRETTGLAMSSRNLRLNDRQKQDATGISKMLHYIRDNYSRKTSRELEQYATDYLLATGFSKVDYVSIADGDTLHGANGYATVGKPVALIAAFVGDVRLIDNEVLQD